MGRSAHGRSPNTGLALAAACLALAGVAVALIAALGAGDRTLDWVALGLLAAAAAMGLWAGRSATRHGEGTSAALQATDEPDDQPRRGEAALAESRELVARLQASRRAEREFTQELRDQIQALHRQHADQVDANDVQDLILRTAIELVEASKGLLLSRHDADGDGDLDVLRAHGFEHDPAGSHVAQRFARQVLARDEIVREDDPPGAGEGSPADQEIDCMVAVPVYLHDRFQGVVICANRDGGFAALDDDLLLALGDHAGASMHHDQLHREVGDARRTAVRMLAEALQAREPLLRRSAGQVSVHARAVARRLELEPRDEETLLYAALLRDVGNLAIHEGLLAKPGPLSPEERAVVELHPRIGFDIVGQMPALREAAFAILYHHERYDGRGYPAGLAGDRIPLPARVIGVVEAYDAMTQERPYRTALSPEEAVEELVAGAGTQFDPEIAQLFIEELGRSGRVPEAVADAAAELAPFGMPATDGDLPGDGLASLTDALTLLPGHRAFREAIEAAAREATPDSPFSVVLVLLEGLSEINRQDGYAAGDRVIQMVGRGARRAAASTGGRVYRDSGRRIGVLCLDAGEEEARRLVLELHTEFAIGPQVRIASAVWAPGQSAQDVIERLREGLALA